MPGWGDGACFLVSALSFLKLSWGDMRDRELVFSEFVPLVFFSAYCVEIRAAEDMFVV
jgi:hypothetical protein